MTPATLRAWQRHMNFTQAKAARALGMSRSGYCDLLSGVHRGSGRPIEISRRTALACAAIAAGLGEWVNPG